MKKFVIAAAILTVAPTGAFAKEMSATIKSVDKAKDAVVLNSGQTLTLPEGIEAETLKAGEKVLISLATDTAGKTVVTAIKPAK